MNIVEQGREFVQRLRQLAKRTGRDWRTCPWCGGQCTIKYGHYWRHPWTEEGRQEVAIQRHKCHECRRTYSEEKAWLVWGSWYARSVHRWAIDQWLHGRTSLRRVAEFTRSHLGKQERWWMWHPLEERGTAQPECRLHASTLQRWLDRAGIVAQGSVAGQMKGITSSGEMATDGLWARLRGGTKRVVLILVDSLSGLVWPPVVAPEEESASSWARLFARAERAGLDLARLNGLSSDGAQGLLSHLREALSWVHQQRCVWHLWRGLGGRIAAQVRQAVAGLATEQGERVAKELRQELCGLVHDIFDASSYEQGERALNQLFQHPWGGPVATFVLPLLDAALMHLLPVHQGLGRVSPEWYWRDYRQRLSRGRNHATDTRLERGALVWAIYRNFTPAQRRSELKRHYKHPGQSPLEVAGARPGSTCYLDALCV